MLLVYLSKHMSAIYAWAFLAYCTTKVSAKSWPDTTQKCSCYIRIWFLAVTEARLVTTPTMVPQNKYHLLFNSFESFVSRLLFWDHRTTSTISDDDSVITLSDNVQAVSTHLYEYIRTKCSAHACLGSFPKGGLVDDDLADRIYTHGLDIVWVALDPILFS